MDFAQSWFADLGNYLMSSVLPGGIIALLGIRLVGFIMGLVTRALEATHLEKAAHGFLKTCLRILLYGLLALIVASKLGIDVTGVVALAGVLTLAVSLSVQNALTNLISGIALLYTRPFSAGDLVEAAGRIGVIHAIGLTYTELTTPDNTHIFLPNSAVTAGEILNYTLLGTRRVEIEIAVGYTAPVEEVLEALYAAAQVPTALSQPEPFAAVSRYGDSAVYYMLHVWTAAADYWTTLYTVNSGIPKALEARNIPLPYPHVHIHQDF